MAAQPIGPGQGGRRRQRAQGSLFEDVVDLDAVRENLGLEGCFRVAMEVRESMLRKSRMYRELPLDVFDRAAERNIEERLAQIGRERGLHHGVGAKIDFR